MPDSEKYKLFSPNDIVRSGLCIGCGSCAAQSGSLDINMGFDSYGQLKPKGNDKRLNQRSDDFSQLCPFSPASKNEDYLASKLYPEAHQRHSSSGRFLKAYVGHVSEDSFRENGSSGGMVSWVLTELLRKKLIDGVAHVGAIDEPQKEGKFFSYRISRTEEEIRQSAKSRYYPVEMSEILEIIRNVPGRYAIVGVPCFIKAVQLLRLESPLFKERIAFTLGLFCGHFKSARFIESFAWQMGVSVDQVQRVNYRLKDATRPANWYCAELTLTDGSTVKKDWWHMADGDWGAGYFMNSACNFCDDVVAETADISFGDAWVEPYSLDGNGTNVVITRSPVIENLITDAVKFGRLQLKEVDGEFIEQTQAAGLRQRREGLGYRLAWHRLGIKPRKRVAPDAKSPTKRRKLIYRMRNHISAWSHRVFWLARLIKKPKLYIRWAETVAKIYHCLAYHRGKLGEIFEQLGLL